MCADTGEGTCTKAEVAAYESCIQNACDVTFKECYGAGYKSGKFGGACGDFITCANACECNDLACLTSCPTPSAACETCSAKVDTCSKQCAEPECMKRGNDGPTCADLADCCAAKADEEERTTCEQVLELAGGNDVSCGAIYSSQCE